MKSKDLHLYNEKGRTFEYPMEERLLTFSTEWHGQTFKQLQKNLPLLIAIVVLHLKSDLKDQ